MNEILQIAIAKAVSDATYKKASMSLAAGRYRVNKVVRIKGVINKGEDSNQVVHMSIPHWKLIAVLMSKVNGITLDAVVREALELEDDKASEIKEQADAAIAVIKGTSKKMTAGKVTAKLEVVEIDNYVKAEVEEVLNTIIKSQQKNVA